MKPKAVVIAFGIALAAAGFALVLIGALKDNTEFVIYGLGALGTGGGVTTLGTRTKLVSQDGSRSTTNRPGRERSTDAEHDR